MAAHPEYFWLLGLIVPLMIIIITGYHRGRHSLIKTSGKWRPDDFYDLFTVKYFFISFGFIVFVVFTVLALAGFPGREYPVSYEPSGTDIVFAVDVSRSMKSEDISPSRIKMSKRIIRSICENSRGGRFGVVVFKGKGVNIVPVTEDLEAVYSFLNYLSTDLLTSPGTNLESGLKAAVEAFPGGEERRKYIVLLSDGEALDGEVDEILKQAAGKKISVYSVGIGTPAGAAIPSGDGYILDPSGEKVISRLDEQRLKTAAESTGGRYYNIASNELLPDLISLAGSGSIDRDEGIRIERRERYVFFLVFALLGLIVSRLTKVVKWKNYF